MDVSIIIISFNTRELTLACLRSVYEQTTNVSFEVIVVDNASQDGSAEAISGAFSETRLIKLDQNVGFARANNVAAALSTAQFLLLLNPDTVILDGAIQRALEFAVQHPTAKIVGGRTFFENMRLNENSCHGQPTVWSMFCMGTGLTSVFRGSALFNPEGYGGWKRETAREVEAVTGCFLLIQRTLWNTLNGFDESFFMYGEDTDLCIRARKTGCICMICPDCRLIHYGGQSETVRSDKMVKLFRAKAQLMRKHWRPGTHWFGIAMLQLWAASRLFVYMLADIVRAEKADSSAQWLEIWRRRREFLRA